MLLLASILSQAPSPTPSVASGVAAADERFVRDLHDKNIDDVLTLYTADAVFVNPDGHEIPASGLRKLYEQVTAALDSDLHLSTVRIKRHGRTAVETGTYTETLGHRDTGKIDNIQGTFRFTFRREQDGRWRYTRMEWH